MKNSSDTIGNQTCDLPACSAMPQPTAPPHTPEKLMCPEIIYNVNLSAHTMELKG